MPPLRAALTALSVAIKIFDPRVASYQALLREADALQEIRHPNTVRILESGQSDDGHLFIVMEFLEGETLEAKCARSFRLQGDEASAVLRSLLSALESFHPNAERVIELGAKQELTVEEFYEFEHVRQGYVHRDVKPQNVILVAGRGPVLIDFGLASKISSSVVTRSQTPGYWPPDFDGLVWTEDVDLYQLGLTMLQVLVGARYDGELSTCQSMRAALESEDGLDETVKDVVLRLTCARRQDRWRSAREALAVLPEVPSPSISLPLLPAS